MKKSDITYLEKLNELRLDISHPNSRGLNFIFLEGETDIRLFRKFFDIEKCKVENIPGGNSKVEECVQTLVAVYPLVVGIRDSDFIRLSGNNYNIRNVFLTDFHDIEMTMLNSEPILNSLVFEYSDIPKNEHINFRQNIINSILSLSYLKWLNDLENLELNFSSGFIDLISFVNQTIDINQYIDRVLAKSNNAKVTSREELIQKLETLKIRNPDLLQLTNGHDLLKAFAEYFKSIGGRNGISGEVLESSLRMAFNKTIFQMTNLYASLTAWQATNGTQLFST